MARLIDRRNIQSMLKKEFRQLFRDPRMRAMIFGPPVLMLLLFGYAVNTDVNDVAFALLDSDRSAASREYASLFTASPHFTLHAAVDSAGPAVTMLDRGEIDFFLNIERGFSKKIKRGEGAHVQFLIDGSDSSRASVIIAYVNAIMASYSEKIMRSRITAALQIHGVAGAAMPGSIDLRERVFFNQEMTSRNYFLPGVIGLVIALITIMVTSMSIVKERESGTIEQINVSPLSPLEYIAGKMAPFSIVAIIDICLATGLTIFWFGVPFRGSFVFLLLSGAAFILSTLAVGLYISTISTTQQQAMLSSFLFFIPAIMLSGFIFPIYAMPESIQMITWLNPLRYFIEIIRSVFLKGVGIAVLWKQLIFMLLLGAGLLLLSVKRYHKRME
jgi:ABC-2 type transport system permease protein